MAPFVKMYKIYKSHELVEIWIIKETLYVEFYCFQMLPLPISLKKYSSNRYIAI